MELFQLILFITASASAIRVPVWHKLDLHIDPSSSTRLKNKSRLNNVHNSWHNNPKNTPAEAVFSQSNLYYTDYKTHFPVSTGGRNNKNINKTIAESKNVNQNKRTLNIGQSNRPYKTIKQYAKQYHYHPNHQNKIYSIPQLNQVPQSTNVIKHTVYPKQLNNKLNYNYFVDNKYLQFGPSSDLRKDTKQSEYLPIYKHDTKNNLAERPGKYIRPHSVNLGVHKNNLIQGQLHEYENQPTYLHEVPDGVSKGSIDARQAQSINPFPGMLQDSEEDSTEGNLQDPETTPMSEFENTININPTYSARKLEKSLPDDQEELDENVEDEPENLEYIQIYSPNDARLIYRSESKLPENINKNEDHLEENLEQHIEQPIVDPLSKHETDSAERPNHFFALNDREAVLPEVPVEDKEKHIVNDLKTEDFDGSNIKPSNSNNFSKDVLDISERKHNSHIDYQPYWSPKEEKGVSKLFVYPTHPEWVEPTNKVSVNYKKDLVENLSETIPVFSSRADIAGKYKELDFQDGNVEVIKQHITFPINPVESLWDNWLKSPEIPDIHNVNSDQILQTNQPIIDDISTLSIYPREDTWDKWVKPSQTSIVPNEDLEEIKQDSKNNPIIQKDIPTRPIYPGEGVWAIRGTKHYPYINNQKYTNSQDDKDDDPRPDGFETFESENLQFQKKQQNFQNHFNNLPQQENQNVPENDQEERATKVVNNDDIEEIEDGIEKEYQETDLTTEFVPIRLYAQVRKYEDEEHLPASVLEPRLRKIVKDSKVHTVYTEEGYEDSGYNHAGHEKNAENDEGYVEFDKEAHKAKDVEDSEAEGSVYLPKNLMKTNNFAQTELTKTTEVKDIGNGNMKYETQNKMKYMVSPDNDTKIHSYVKIMPKTIEVAKSVQIPSSTNNISSFNYTKSDNTRPKLDADTAVEIMKDIKEHFVIRAKRNTEFVNDFPAIEVDTDFIDKLKFKETKPIEDTTYLKYPYYNSRTVSKDSPLRYAQDMKDIPIKTANEMSFYDQANKMKCQEVETNVNPIPESLDDGEEPDEDTPQPSLPRLSKLGDKIDCFKVKYFGENPLDSPIFTEDIIESPQPIFKEFEQLNEITTNSEQEKVLKEKNKIPIHEKIALATDVMDYEELVTVSSADELKINLNIAKSFNSTRQPKVSDLIFDLQKKSDNATDLEVLSPESMTLIADDLIDNKDNGTEALPGSLPLRLKRRRRKRPQASVYNNNRHKPMSRYPLVPQTYRFNELYPTMYTSTSTPKTNLISEVHYKNEIKPSEQLNVFADIINNIKNSSREEMVHVASENQQILASQLPPWSYKQQNLRRVKEPYDRNKNVDTDDVYKNFYQTSTLRPTGFVSNRKKNKTRTFVPSVQIYDDYMTAMKKNVAYQRDDLKIDNLHQISNKKVLSTMPHLRNNKRKTKRRPQYSYPIQDIEAAPSKIVSSTQSSQYLDENLSNVGTVFANNNDYQANSKKLLEPASSYTTIDVPLNMYYVPGMKPPASLEKPYDYSDYKLVNTNHISRRNAFANHRMRRKRSTSRLMYAEIQRGQSRRPIIKTEKEAEVEEQEEEYVPHRPTNYHYDVETDKIIYEKKKDEEILPEEEEIEYEDIEEETKKPPKSAKPSIAIPQTVYLKDVLNKKNGPTLVDYLAKLKSDPRYHEIADPKPTEKTIIITTTQKPEKTTPPEFLSFLNKLHNNENYKNINDADEAKKAKAKTKLTTTTPEAEPEEAENEDDEEEVASNVEIKNSPGGQYLSTGQLQIFDISEYLPKVKTYAPRTPIDYSKYKTIERTTVNSRHNLSSRYSEDEDELPLDKKNTNQEPIVELNRPTYEDSNNFNRRRNPERIPVIEKPYSENNYEENQEEESSYPEEITSTATIITDKPTTQSAIQMRFRSRKRPTTTRGTTTNAPELTTETRTTPMKIHTHRPPMRLYERRPSPRIRIRSTTSTTTTEEIKPEDVTKKTRRRQRTLHDETRDVPTNHKAFYTPILVEDRIDMDPIYRESKKKPRLVTPDILNYNNTNYSKDRPGEINPRKIDFEVFKTYDKSKRHGGNYIRNPNQKETGTSAYKIEDSEEIKQLSDIVPKPFSHNADSGLPSKINTLQESAPTEIKYDLNTEKDDDQSGDTSTGDYQDIEVPEDDVQDDSIAKSIDYEYNDEVKIYFKDDDTKKAVIVKDPSKRLYFYASV